MVTVLVTGSSNAIANTSTEQVYAKSAPTATEALRKPLMQKMQKALQEPNPSESPETPKCKPHWLVKQLEEAGFEGKGLRIAWAIAMRESGGRADAISSTGDYGVFQFNRAAHSDQPWWNTAKMLDRDYNIMIAYQISQEGKTFYPWDIDGNGKHKGNYTSSGVYNKYKSWYDKYPCYNK